MRSLISKKNFTLLPDHIAAGLLIAGLCLILANVVGRYIFNSAIIWAEEVMIYIMVWCVLLGCLSGVLKNAHLNMDLCLGFFPLGLRRFLSILTCLVGGLTCAIVAFVSAQVFTLMWTNHQVSLVAGIPMTIPHGALLVGFTMMAAASFYMAFDMWRNPNKTCSSESE